MIPRVGFSLQVDFICKALLGAYRSLLSIHTLICWERRRYTGFFLGLKFRKSTRQLGFKARVDCICRALISVRMAFLRVDSESSVYSRLNSWIEHIYGALKFELTVYVGLFSM